MSQNRSKSTPRKPPSTDLWGCLIGDALRVVRRSGARVTRVDVPPEVLNFLIQKGECDGERLLSMNNPVRLRSADTGGRLYRIEVEGPRIEMANRPKRPQMPENIQTRTVLPGPKGIASDIMAEGWNPEAIAVGIESVLGPIVCDNGATRDPFSSSPFTEYCVRLSRVPAGSDPWVCCLPGTDGHLREDPGSPLSELAALGPRKLHVRIVRDLIKAIREKWPKVGLPVSGRAGS